jgi:hypothetical protein
MAPLPMCTPENRIESVTSARSSTRLFGPMIERDTLPPAMIVPAAMMLSWASPRRPEFSSNTNFGGGRFGWSVRTGQW